MQQNLLKAAITHGDINGIGYELILKAFQDARLMDVCTPVLYGSSRIAAYHRKALELPTVNFNCISRAADAPNGHVNIINCINEEMKVELGKPSKDASIAAMASLSAAVKDLKANAVDILVTMPVSHRLIPFGDYPDVANFLDRSFEHGAKRALTVMINGNVRIATLTGQSSIVEAAAQVTFNNVTEKIRIFERSLIQDFRLTRPRIAVLSLNPSAGAYSVDSEETTVICPAIEKLNEEGITAIGPFPADSFFADMKFNAFDGVFAMYYDQAAAPFRTLYNADGLFYTAGLPVVHTAPAHGPAYNIAGRTTASEAAFRTALYAAIDIYRNREAHAVATANPLRKQYFDRGSGDDSVDLTKEDDDIL